MKEISRQGTITYGYPLLQGLFFALKIIFLFSRFCLFHDHVQQIIYHGGIHQHDHIGAVNLNVSLTVVHICRRTYVNHKGTGLAVYIDLRLERGAEIFGQFRRHQLLLKRVVGRVGGRLQVIDSIRDFFHRFRVFGIIAYGLSSDGNGGVLDIRGRNLQIQSVADHKAVIIKTMDSTVAGRTV